MGLGHLWGRNTVSWPVLQGDWAGAPYFTWYRSSEWFFRSWILVSWITSFVCSGAWCLRYHVVASLGKRPLHCSNWSGEKAESGIGGARLGRTRKRSYRLYLGKNSVNMITSQSSAANLCKLPKFLKTDYLYWIIRFLKDMFTCTHYIMKKNKVGFCIGCSWKDVAPSVTIRKIQINA